MAYRPREGDIILTGMREQAIVSRAIKLGSVLRFQKYVARTATAAQLAILAGAVAVAIAVTKGAVADIAVVLGGFVAGIVAVWIVATVGRNRSAYWSWFNHTGVAVRHPESGALVIAEALAKGVRYSPIDKYSSGDCRWIRTRVADENCDLQQFRAYVENVVEAKQEYGLVIFAWLAVYCITASLTFLPTLVLMQSGTAICSGFVCDALRSAGYIWKHEAFFMMPADIVEKFGADQLLTVGAEPAWKAAA